MIPADLATEATVYREALLGSVIEPAEVVAWADAWLLRLDEISEALVEAAYSGQRINEMLMSLNQLGSTIWTLTEIRIYFQMLERYLQINPSRLKTVTYALCRLDHEVPESVSAEVYHLDDCLDLALDGIYYSVD